MIKQLVTTYLLLSFTCTAVHADDLIKTIPEGDDTIVVLREGRPAPFDGQLYSNDTALRWANWLSQYQLRLKIDVEVERKVCNAELKYNLQLLDIEVKRSDEVETDLTSRLLKSEEARLAAEERVRDPPFYSTFSFGLVVGLLTAGLIVAAAASGLSAAN